MLIRLQNSFAAMSQMAQHQERTANNLANVNTVGFKRDRTFTAALNERLDAESAPRSTRVTTAFADQQLGHMDATGGRLDVALSGEGFFVLNDAATGTQRYTRDGRFTLDAEGMLRSLQGHAVEGASGPIQIPPEGGSIDISRNGEVRVGGETVGQIQVVTFEDPSRLQRLDGAAFAAGTATPTPAENPVVLQGFLEGSNVNAIGEMTDMIEHHRLFEFQQKALRTTDQVLAGTVRDLARF